MDIYGNQEGSNPENGNGKVAAGKGSKWEKGVNRGWTWSRGNKLTKIIFLYLFFNICYFLLISYLFIFVFMYLKSNE